MWNDQLVEAWVHGWALSRETQAPMPRPYGFELSVGLPEHVARHVLPQSRVEHLQELAKSIDQPWIFIKASASPALVRAALSAEWKLMDTHTLMSIRLDEAIHASGDPAGVFETTLRRDGDLILATVRDGAQLAASGSCGIAGRFGVFDKIVTDPAYQRRGLGRFVMRMLTTEAAALGVTHGVLVATDEGRALYKTLGWHAESDWTTAVRCE